MGPQDPFVQIIRDRVAAKLTEMGHTVTREPGGHVIEIDGIHVMLYFKYYAEKAGRRFTIDASGHNLPGREGKFAYKDLTTDVNYDLIVKTLLQQVELERQALEDIKASAEIRKDIEAFQEGLGIGIFSDIELRPVGEGKVQLDLPLMTLAQGIAVLSAIANAGLLENGALRATSKEDEAEVPAANQT